LGVACSVKELDDESAVHVDVPGASLCLARSRGAVHALLDECSHGQVRLSERDVERAGSSAGCTVPASTWWPGHPAGRQRRARCRSFPPGATGRSSRSTS